MLIPTGEDDKSYRNNLLTGALQSLDNLRRLKKKQTRRLYFARLEKREKTQVEGKKFKCANAAERVQMQRIGLRSAPAMQNDDDGIQFFVGNFHVDPSFLP
jgi:hypothetical protein